MFVWKFAYSKSIKKRVLIKLELEPQTFIYLGSEGSSGKCRASKASVMGIYDGKGKKLNLNTAYSAVNLKAKTENFKYQVGVVAIPKNIFSYSPEDCASGIHFYMTRGMAAKKGKVP